MNDQQKEIKRLSDELAAAVRDYLHPPLELPTEPGTVIAVGEWWFIRLRPYTDGVPAAWELLPAPERVDKHMKVMGIKTQCIYPDDWVRAEAEQDRDGLRIISAPVKS